VHLIQPVDWTRGAGRPRAERPSSVDIIIPIYGAPDDLARCLASVAKHTDLARHRVILVIDGPQDVQDFPNAPLLRNDRRLGYAASVNRGMGESKTDVVLLNSDTIVTARWLEKLIDAAYSNGDVGTVTPLSNNATLVSVPRAFEENLIPSGYDIDSFAQHVESESSRHYPRLPTGVGFCLYIRRALLDDIGLFDAHRFAAGYGEENDFCWRALARGWLNIADDATFVFHAGHRSFGASRKRAQRRAKGLLPRRYTNTIAEYMKTQKPQPTRGLRITHLVHGWPPYQHAGTELYAYWLAHRQRDANTVSVYTRSADPTREEGDTFELDDHGIRVRFVTNHFTARNPLRRNAIRDRVIERDFERFLKQEKPDVLHAHHLAGHAFSLLGVARRLQIPIVMQIQDWWFLCARVNLYHRDGNRCSGPSPEKCADCVTLTRLPLSNRLLHAIRRRAALSALQQCDAFIVGSNAIRDDYAKMVPHPIHVIPYGISVGNSVGRRRPRRREPGPIRFGYVGSISPHKGIHTANEAMQAIDPNQATFQVWGDQTANPDYAKTLTNSILKGPFKEEEKQTVYEEMDVLLVPSIGLESFGLAAREAMACGVPVIATSGGALHEMSAEFFPAGDATALRAIIQRVIADPSIIDRWREQIREPKRDDVHAAEIERVYRSVLER